MDNRLMSLPAHSKSPALQAEKWWSRVCDLSVSGALQQGASPKVFSEG